MAGLSLGYLCTEHTDPYHNLALEECLLDTVREGELLLYLWQNRHTVVIGRNQSAQRECNIPLLEAEGGTLARRPSGGGAVYHDMGNLNFTFLTHQRDYDVSRQLDVIVAAVASFGVAAEKTGRNDVCADGRKFSGNAFLRRGDRCYHHGTLLVDVDLERLSRYLTVSEDKLAAKGVASVKSRVVNLSALCGVEVASMKAAMIRAFSEVYGCPAAERSAQTVVRGEALAALQKKHASDAWRLGEPLKADLTLERRFSWGAAALSFQREGGMVKKLRIHSDAMEAEAIACMEAALTGARFDRRALRARLAACSGGFEDMARDVGALIDSAFLAEERGTGRGRAENDGTV